MHVCVRVCECYCGASPPDGVGWLVECVAKCEESRVNPEGDGRPAARTRRVCELYLVWCTVPCPEGRRESWLRSMCDVSGAASGLRMASETVE